jgi:hypothetical protein
MFLRPSASPDHAIPELPVINRLRSFLIGAAACALFLVSPASFGQDADSPDEPAPRVSPDETVTNPAPPSVPGLLATSTNEIDIRVADCGVGDAARYGDWFAMRVEIQDNGPKVRNVVVRLSITDSDGDIAQYQRAALPNTGRWESVWLYARMPFHPPAELVVSVHEAIEREGADAADESGNQPLRFDAGRMLGVTRYPLQARVPEHVATWLLIGDRFGGLQQYYQTRLPGATIEAAPPTGHELVDITSVASVNRLPDRWMGYTQFALLAWNGGAGGSSALTVSPSQLSEDQANAIKTWVRRGGHLVVVLPPVGQPWIGSGAVGNPLADIMPTVTVRRVEGVDLENIRKLFTNDGTAPMPRSATVQYLLPSGADAYSAVSLYEAPMPEGDLAPVAVRRLVGAGAVTVVGVDVTSPQLSDTVGALQAGRFWGRVLGRQMETLSQGEILRRAKNDQFLSRPTVGSAYKLDGGVRDFITMSAQAAGGLLMAFFMFGAYWLVAGPGGYFALKSRGKVHYSWLAFLGATVMFTGLAWGGVTLLKGRRVQLKHVTLVDHVYGQSNQRARTWLNIYFPGYGEAKVACPASSGDGTGLNLVAPWDAPERTASSGSFPDARGYVADSRTPTALTVPIRATSKQFQVDWAGSLGMQWQMPLPQVGSATGEVDAAAQASIRLGTEIKVVPRQRLTLKERTWDLQGQLVHNMPETLHDVQVFLNFGPRSNWLTSELFTECYSASLSKWGKGETLDLSRVFPAELSEADRLGKWMENRPSMKVSSGFDLTFSRSEQEVNFADLAVLNLFPVIQTRSVQQASWATVSAAHTYDVSRWFSEPCLVIIGRLDNVNCPVPITVDGRPLPTEIARNSGPVFVRWMYPLPPRAVTGTGVGGTEPASGDAGPDDTGSSAPPGMGGPGF